MRINLHNLAERIAYRCLRRVFVGYAKVVASGMAQLEFEHRSFREATMRVGTAHAEELRAINRRLEKLERAGA
jgi:hypothetical protein